jgi:ribosome-associated protein
MHEEEFQEDRDQGPSRSAQRRDALAVLEMARQLVELPEAVLARIGMDEDLRELVRTSRKITAQIARKRQIQYLAKHLRRLDEEALAVIRSALQHDRAEHLREARALHAVEHWRDRLLEEGDAALSELLEHYPQADRQHLRQLARNAHQERLKNKPPHAYRDLFRELRELLEASPEAE